MKETGWTAGRRLFSMKVRAQSLTSSGELISSPGPTMWWVISLRPQLESTVLNVTVLRLCLFHRESKSTISAQNSGSQTCCVTMSVWGRTCTPAACVGKTTPLWLLAGGSPSRFAAALFKFISHYRHYYSFSDSLFLSLLRFVLWKSEIPLKWEICPAVMWK